MDHDLLDEIENIINKTKIHQIDTSKVLRNSRNNHKIYPKQSSTAVECVNLDPRDEDNIYLKHSSTEIDRYETLKLKYFDVLIKALNNLVMSQVESIERDNLINRISLVISKLSGPAVQTNEITQYQFLFNQKTITFNIKHLEFCLVDLSFKTWNSAFLLSSLLFEYVHDLFQITENSNILEIGSGSGLLGIVIQYHCQILQGLKNWKLTCSDYDKIILQNVQHNFKLNQSIFYNDVLNDKMCDSNVEFIVLDWFQSPPKSLLHTYSHIFASDVIYNLDSAKQLPSYIHSLLIPNAQSRVFLVLSLRDGFEKELNLFQTEMERIGFVKDVGMDVWMNELENGDNIMEQDLMCRNGCWCRFISYRIECR